MKANVFAALPISLILSAASAQAVDYEWTFNLGDLSPEVGAGVMTYADAATQGITSFSISDGLTVPHIAGVPARYLMVPSLTGLTNGFLLEFTNSGPNGGGLYLNQYSVIMDIYSPGGPNWQALINTNTANGNDADWYISPDNAIGIGGTYSVAGTVQQNQWHRIGFVADLGAGLMKYYVDGNLVATRTGGSLLDGRWSMFSNFDAGPDLLLFNEGDNSGVYTHDLLINSVAFSDTVLSDTAMANLGAPKAEGIFAVPEPTATGLLALCGLGWFMRRRRN